MLSCGLDNTRLWITRIHIEIYDLKMSLPVVQHGVHVRQLHHSLTIHLLAIIYFQNASLPTSAWKPDRLAGVCLCIGGVGVGRSRTVVRVLDDGAGWVSTVCETIGGTLTSLSCSNII